MRPRESICERQNVSLPEILFRFAFCLAYALLHQCVSALEFREGEIIIGVRKTCIDIP